jgi:Ser/Thr protein kinase RdoA (MazF antagonist)
VTETVNSDAVAAAFDLRGKVAAIRPLGGGLINLTFKVQTRQGPGYVLQRLNSRVFPQPLQVMQNVRCVTEHLAGKAHSPALRLVPTRCGQDWYVDAAARVWRCYRYIPQAHAFARSPHARVSHAAARAFGRFAADLRTLNPGRLQRTISGFHDTPQRLARLESALIEDRHGRAPSVAEQADAIARRAAPAGLLAAAQAAGELQEHVVHNDTKLNNVLFHRRTGEPLCVVDLDTVMPGLLLHDFGDLVRSVAAVGEGADTEFDLTHFAALAKGYLEGAGDLLSATDLTYLAIAPRVLTLELAARFLTDYLEGDRYFAITRPHENLERCTRQLALLVSMERQEGAMCRAVEQPARRCSRS